MKHNIFSNFFFSCKLISKKDKWFIFKLSLYALLSAIETFTYPLILKYAVEGIEQAKELKIIILQVGIVTGISLILNIITILLYRGTYYKRQILANELNQDFHLNTLKTDYEKFERPENQDSYEKASRALGSYNGMIGMVCTTFYAISSILSFIIACTIVTLVNPILIILICILAVLKFLLQTYASKKEKKEFRNLTPAIWRRINYTDNISRNLSIGKDLRVYNMDRFIMKERENSINEYLKLIYIKYIPKKSFKFIDNIAIYIENKKVYKVLLRYNGDSWKQLRKLKIMNCYKFVDNPPEEELTDELIKNDNHERLTIIFDKKRGISNIVVGEVYKMLPNQ